MTQFLLNGGSLFPGPSGGDETLRYDVDGAADGDALVFNHLTDRWEPLSQTGASTRTAYYAALAVGISSGLAIRPPSTPLT